MKSIIADFKFSIFYDEIECSSIYSPSIKYTAIRPEIIKSQSDVYRIFDNINFDRKNGIIDIYSTSSSLMIEFKAFNLIDAINSNKSYYAFADIDVELMFSNQILEAIVYTDQTINHYSAEVKDKSFSIISFDSISAPNDDEIILNSQTSFSIKLRKIPREISVEFQKDIIEEFGKEMNKSLEMDMRNSTILGDKSSFDKSLQCESDIDKIAIIAANNNWTNIFNSAINEELISKRVKDQCMRIAIKNGNIEIARLCL